MPGSRLGSFNFRSAWQTVVALVTLPANRRFRSISVVAIAGERRAYTMDRIGPTKTKLGERVARTRTI